MRPIKLLTFFESILIVLALLVVYSAVTSASAQKAETAVPVPGSTLVVATGQEPENLYLYGSSAVAATQIMSTFMDGPIDQVDYVYQPVILEKVPSLADGDAVINAVTVDDGDTILDAFDNVVSLVPGITLINSEGETVVFDGTPVLMNQMVVTFTLKPDIFWSDGTLLTTADSLFSQETDCHPDTPTSKYTCERTASYTTPNANTAVWQGLPGWRDSEYFLRFWTPLPEHILQGTPPGDIPNSPYAQSPLGWGAFQVDQWIAGDSIHLSRNPYYWQPGYPKVDNLVFKFYSDSAQAYQALLAGEVHVIASDLISSDSLSGYLDMAAQGAVAIHTASQPVWEKIDFGILPADARYNFFADVTVRQAVALCTNRQGMSQEFYSGLAEVAHAYVPSEHPLYQASSTSEWAYDPVQAGVLLDAAGWVVGTDGWRYKDGQKFEVTYLTTENNTTRAYIAYSFQNHMANCGIEVHLEFLPSGEFFADGPDGPVFGRQFDLAEYAWVAAPASCNLYLTENIPGDPNDGYIGWDGPNAPGYSNSAYDAACNAGLDSLPGTPEYTTNHIAALETWTEELPVIPLFFHLKGIVSNPNVLGISPQSSPSQDFWNVEVWELTAETELLPTGGTLVSLDQRIQIEMPANAFSETAVLQTTPWLPEPFPAGVYNGGQIFQITAVYSGTDQPIPLNPGITYTIAVDYSPLQLQMLGSGQSGLGLYRWNGSQWDLEATSVVDTINHQVVATPNQLGIWALASNTTPPQIYLPIITQP